MSLRNRWRFLSRFAKALTVFDHTPPRPDGRVVLFSCHDVDRSMVSAGLRFSPILQGIEETFEAMGYGIVRLSHPYAVFGSGRIRGRALTLNYRALAIRLRAVLTRAAAPARLARETALYGELLDRLRPELVVSIQPPAALCLAARERGLKVVEALHGTHISATDRIIGAHMAEPVDQLPHVMLTFDPVSQASLTSMCAGRATQVRQAADPWLLSLRRQRVADERKHPAEAAAPPVKRVLLSLQWGYDGERESLANIIPNGVIHPAVEAAMAATAGTGLEFHVRLHPIQMNSPGYRHHRRHVEGLSRRFVHVSHERATAMPLPLLLDGMSAHMTMSSSSVGEAAVAGVPTLLLCPTLHPGGAHDGMFKELAADGMATFGRLEADSIVAWISSQPLLTPADRPGYDVERQQRAQRAFFSDLLEDLGVTTPVPHKEVA